jgi:hypothetical protein
MGGKKKLSGESMASMASMASMTNMQLTKGV